jgi:hypothetical protein
MTNTGCVGDHPCPELARCRSADATVKDQLHLAGFADGEVFADHLFEEHPAGHPAGGLKIVGNVQSPDSVDSTIKFDGPTR